MAKLKSILTYILLIPLLVVMALPNIVAFRAPTADEIGPGVEISDEGAYARGWPMLYSKYDKHIQWSKIGPVVTTYSPVQINYVFLVINIFFALALLASASRVSTVPADSTRIRALGIFVVFLILVGGLFLANVNEIFTHPMFVNFYNGNSDIRYASFVTAFALLNFYGIYCLIRFALYVAAGQSQDGKPMNRNSAAASVTTS